jgi:hypothetical protein
MIVKMNCREMNCRLLWQVDNIHQNFQALAKFFIKDLG